VTKTVLAAVLAAGARLAEPGEFTKRAFLNGRLDLTQAEAVADVIHAQTELALQAAQEQLAGKLAERINGVRDRLMIALAHIEAHLDFPDEDITPDTQEALQVRISGAIAYLETLLASAREGQVLREGVKTAIIGRPNAGKSSLLNQLLGRERAIVSPVAGTTRDTIEEVANIRGIPVVFVDTAGMRESGDQVEQEGIRRSREAASAADLVLHVIDGSSTVAADDAALVAEFAFKTRVLVWNKVDLAKPTFPSDGIGVSCITGEGMEALKDAIAQAVWQGDAQGSHGHACINARHQDALRRSHASLQRTQAALKAGAALELVAFELRSATAAIGEIVGKTATDDLLDRIFSQFCLGK
jgi:tRNA modification GTPase